MSVIYPPTGWRPRERKWASAFAPVWSIASFSNVCRHYILQLRR